MSDLEKRKLFAKARSIFVSIIPDDEDAELLGYENIENEDLVCPTEIQEKNKICEKLVKTLQQIHNIDCKFNNPKDDSVDDATSDNGDKFIRTNMTDYNNKHGSDQEEEVDKELENEFGIRNIVGSLSSSTSSKLISTLSSLITRRVDAVDLLPATQDERANEEVISSKDKAAMTLTKSNMTTGIAYVYLISLPGAWAAGLVDVGLLSAVSALVKRWAAECRGREKLLMLNEHDHDVKGVKKRKQKSTGSFAANKRLHGRSRVELSEDLDAENFDSSDNYDKKDLEIISLGLELAVSLSRAVDLVEFKSWSSHARECHIDSMITALATSTALSAVLTQQNCRGNTRALASRNLCFRAISALRTSIETCATENNYILCSGKLQIERRKSRRQQRMRPSMIDDSNIVGERRETLLFILRHMLPLITSQIELPNGQRGKETTYDVVASILEKVVKITSQQMKIDNETLIKSPKSSTRKHQQRTPLTSICVNTDSGNYSARTTPQTTQKKRIEFTEGTPMVPPSLKKNVSPKINFSNVSKSQRDTYKEKRHVRESNIRPLVRALVGMLQKLAICKGLERANARAKMVKLLTKCSNFLPCIEKHQFMEFCVQLCKSKLSSHRVFGVEFIGQTIFSSAWSETNDNCQQKQERNQQAPPKMFSPTDMVHNSLQSSIPSEELNTSRLVELLMTTLCDRVTDRSPVVRARTCYSLSEALKQINAKTSLEPTEEDQFDEDIRIAKNNAKRCLSKFGSGIVKSLKKRILSDQGASVRKAAILAWTEVIIFDVSVGINNIQDDCSILDKLCNDPSVATRKAAADALTVILEMCYENDVASSYLQTIEFAWTNYVLPLSLDVESSCASKATHFFQSLVLDPLIEAQGEDSEFPSRWHQNRYMIAWRILSKVNDTSSRPGSTRGNMKALIKCLDSVFSNAEENIYSFSVPLLQEIHHSIFQTLELDTDSKVGKSVPDKERTLRTSNSPNISISIDLDTKGVATWCLLEAMSQTYRKSTYLKKDMNVGSSEKKLFYLNEAMSRSKIDTSYLVKSWKKLLHNCCTQGIVKGKKSHSVLNAASCLRVISMLAHHMSHTETQELSSSLQTLIISLCPELVGPAIVAITALKGRICIDDSSCDLFRDCTEWVNEIFGKCEVALNSIISSGTFNEENTVRLERIVYLIGEISMIGFAIDEDFPPKLIKTRKNEEKNSPPLTDSLRGMFVRPPSSVLRLIQALILPRLPEHRQITKENTPSSVRAHAYVALGKFCLRDEQLAQKTLNILVQEIHDKKIECDPSVQGNALLVLGDLCIRYTNLVDKFLQAMASCLQSGVYHFSTAYKIGLNQNVNENAFVNVRKNAIILISNLLMQDYIKWRGLLLQRFLVSTVDSNAGVSRLAEATLCGPLLSKTPNLFYNHFVSTIFVLNACKAHPIYKSAVTSGQCDTATGVDFAGIDLSGQKQKEKRFYIYAIMLSNLSDEEKIGVTARITKEILGAATESNGDLHEACKLSSLSNEDVYTNGEAKTTRRHVDALNVLMDSFNILTNPILRVGNTRNSTGEEEDDLNNTVDATGPSNAQIVAVKGRLLSKISRKQLIETVFPILCRLKGKLEKNRAPLLKHLMRYLVDIFRKYKSEVKELLANNPILLQEIEYDTRRYEENKKNDSFDELEE